MKPNCFRSRTALVVALTTVAGIALLGGQPATPAHAQDPPGGTPATMPDGWQNLAAAAFVDAAEELFAAETRPTAEHRAEVVAHAWSRFLNDADFVTGGDWPTVQALLEIFVPRRASRVRAGIPADQVEVDLTAVRTRVEARLQNEPELVTGNSFEGLKVMTSALQTTGYAKPATARLFVDWMVANPWQDLPIGSQYDLYEQINLDQVDYAHFSARWTGTLTPPVTGRYTFEQLQQYAGDDTRLKVSVDGRLVLDSSTDLRNRTRFQSQPVDLTADRPATLQVDAVQDIGHTINYSQGAPMVALLWQSDQLDRQLVPSTALAPPEGFGPQGAHGLKGEYFANTRFDTGQLKTTRLDPALDLAWSWDPVAPVYPDQCSALIDACKAKLLDDAFLAAVPPEDRSELLTHVLWRMAYRLPLTERRELVVQLTGHRELLEATSAYVLGSMMQAVYMLPGNEHLNLLGEWAEARSHPRCKMGIIPGSGAGRYSTHNLEFYWYIGYFMQGPYWEDVETLWDDFLVRSNGECNLRIAYLTAFAAQVNSKGDLLQTRLQERLDDETLTGDRRMTWLLARAYLKSLLVGGQPRVSRGLPLIEQAVLTANSDDYRFWAVQELIARLASVDRGEQAKALITRYEGKFTEPDQQAAMSQWRTEADQLAVVYASRRQTEGERQAEAAQATYIARLRKRLAGAQQRGDTADIARYERLLESGQADDTSDQ